MERLNEKHTPGTAALPRHRPNACQGHRHRTNACQGHRVIKSERSGAKKPACASWRALTTNDIFAMFCCQQSRKISDKHEPGLCMKHTRTWRTCFRFNMLNTPHRKATPGPTCDLIQRRALEVDERLRLEANTVQETHASPGTKSHSPKDGDTKNLAAIPFSTRKSRNPSSFGHIFFFIATSTSYNNLGGRLIQQAR